MSFLKELKSQERGTWLLTAVLALVLTLCAALGVSHKRQHYKGDEFSNEAVWRAGKNFYDVGLVALRGIPVQSEYLKAQSPDFEFQNPSYSPDQKMVEFDRVNDSDRPHFYTHYPPGADWVQFGLFKLGLMSWRQHQTVSIALSFLGAFFFWMGLRVLFSVPVALVIWGFYLCSPGFFFFADSFQQFSWFIFLKGFLFWWILVLQKKSAEQYRLGHGVLIFILCLWASFFSFDAIPTFLSIVLILSGDMGDLKKRKWILGFIALAALGEGVGFFLHLAKNALILGQAGAIEDLWDTFLYRSGESLSGYHFLKHIGKGLFGLNWFFGALAVVLAVLGWMQSRMTGLRLGLFVGTLTGAIFWQIFCKQHGMFHAFTYRHFDYFVVLGLGFFIEGHRKKIWPILLGTWVVIRAVTSLAGWEGVSWKEPLIREIIPQQQLEEWACEEWFHVGGNQDFPQTKKMIQEMLPQQKYETCTTKSGGLKLSLAQKYLSEFVLYLK